MKTANFTIFVPSIDMSSVYKYLHNTSYDHIPIQRREKDLFIHMPVYLFTYIQI